MADLTICGAGIFGLSIAWEALQRGARVTVVDPNGPGAGASGGIVGALQPHTPEPWNEKKQFQLESLCRAQDFWSEVDAKSGVSSGYARVGRLQPLRTEREVELARSRSHAARQNWGDAFDWEVLETCPSPKWCPPSPTGFFVRDTLSAILNPQDATRSLATALCARDGASIVADAPLEGTVIWATGWQGLLDLSDKFDKPVGNGVKGQAILLDHNAAHEPQIYADALHVIPHTNGTVAIGSTSERVFDAPDTTDDQVDDLHARAVELLPVLRDATVLARWAGVRPRANSRAPLLGPWPGRQGHFIANGGFKIGFGMAPKCAEVLLDMILEDRDSIPASFHTNSLA